MTNNYYYSNNHNRNRQHSSSAFSSNESFVFDWLRKSVLIIIWMKQQQRWCEQRQQWYLWLGIRRSLQCCQSKSSTSSDFLTGGNDLNGGSSGHKSITSACYNNSRRPDVKLVNILIWEIQKHISASKRPYASSGKHYCAQYRLFWWLWLHVISWWWL